MTACLLQKVRGGEFPVNPHIAHVTGVQSIPSPSYYRDTRTGAAFSHIAGGLAYPTPFAPGFVLVVGVDRAGIDDPAIRVLDEAEADTVEGVLSECLRLRQRYGYPAYHGILDLWIGDHERFQSLVSEFNMRFGDNGKAGVHIAPPPDFERPDRFEVFLRRVHGMLAFGKKRLFLNSTKLRNLIQNFTPEAMTRPEKFPALDCLGGLVHYLMSAKPWLQPTSAVLEETFETVAIRLGSEAWGWIDDETETYEGDEE